MPACLRCFAHQTSIKNKVLVTPWRLELQSAEPESDILSIELRGQKAVTKIRFLAQCRNQEPFSLLKGYGLEE